MIQSRRSRFALAALVCVALMLAVVGSAFADITNTWVNCDFSFAHISPLQTDTSANGKWTVWSNQNLTISQLSGWYTTHDVTLDTDTNVQSAFVKLSVNDSTPTTFTAPVTLSKEGTYTLVGSSIDGSGTPFTGALNPWGDDFVGIDKTRPVASTNAKPVYDQVATVTVSATDTLSGAQYLFSSLDGEADWATATVTAAMNSVEVTAGVGSHSLAFFAVDNAGNFSVRQTVNFSVNPQGYVPVLSTPLVTVAKKKYATFKGTATAATGVQTIKLVLERKSGKKWKSAGSYFAKVAQYATSYSLTKKISKAGTYRVRAWEGTAKSSSLRTFKIK